jgi:hypothetical protein
VQLILKVFFDVILLRRGPEDIPKSALLLMMAIASAVVVNMLFGAMVETVYETDFSLEFATELIKIASYIIVLAIFGLMSRLMQTMTAIIGCNAILGIVSIAVLMLSQQFNIAELDGILAWLVIFWLILVEGHIISRAVKLHLITGVATAVVIFILQIGFYYSFVELPEGAVG